MSDLKILALLSVVGFSIYLNTLGHQFVNFDDARLIVNNPFIKNFNNILQLLPPAYFSLHDVPNLIRPVSIASTIIDYKIWQLNPFGYHLTNVLLHTLATILSYALIKTLFGPTKLALFAALVFALHPIHTENVNAVSFRQDIIAFVFMAIAFLAFVKSRQDLKKHYLALLILAYIGATLAFFAKEAVIILPVLIGFYEWFFVFPGYKKSLKEKVVPYLPLLAITAAFLVIRSSRFEYRFPEPDEYGQIINQTTTYTFSYLEERISLMANAFAIYLKLLLWPIRLVADYGAPDQFNQFTLKTMVNLIISIIPLGFAIYFRKKARIITFGILWIYIALIPTSNLIPLVNHTAERYLYIPSLGFAVIVSFVFLRLEKWRSRLAYLVLILLLLFYGTRTLARNRDWVNNLAIWGKTYSQNPTNLKAINNLAASYIDEKIQVEKAIKLLEPVVEEQNFNPTTYKNLGLAYLIIGENKKAINILNKAVAINPNQAATYRLLALAYQFEGETNLEIKNLEIAIGLEPKFKSAYIQLINAYREKGLEEKAKSLEQQLLKFPN